MGSEQEYGKGIEGKEDDIGEWKEDDRKGSGRSVGNGAEVREEEE